MNKLLPFIIDWGKDADVTIVGEMTRRLIENIVEELPDVVVVSPSVPPRASRSVC